MYYMRHPKYTAIEWQFLFGTPLDGVVGWVEAAMELLPAGVKVESFQDPAGRTVINTDHLLATAHGVALFGPGGPTAITRGDLAGWAGDLITLYAEWVGDGSFSTHASGYEFCVDRMAQNGVVSSFGLTDFVEDVDGYLIGREVWERRDLDEVLNGHYGQGYANRFYRFFHSRFDGDRDRAVLLARAVLTRDVRFFVDDAVTYPALTSLLYRYMQSEWLPEALPPYKLDPFLQGFASRVEQLAQV